MMPILLHLGSFSVYAYGLMLGIAFVVGDLIVLNEFARKGYDSRRLPLIAICVAAAALIGSRLNQILDVGSAGAGGYTYYGGFILCLPVTWVLARRAKIGWLA